MASLKTGSPTLGDGSVTLSLKDGESDGFYRHTIQIDVSAAPSAGSATVQARMNGASQWENVAGSLNLATGPRFANFDGMFAEVKVTVAGFDGDKTWTAILASQ